jgi:hypothetical protein
MTTYTPVKASDLPKYKGRTLREFGLMDVCGYVEGVGIVATAGTGFARRDYIWHPDQIIEVEDLQDAQ